MKTFVIILLLPFILGWKKVDLREYLKIKRQEKELTQEKEQEAKDLWVSQGLSPYKILEKTTASFYKLKNCQLQGEVWLEHPLFHLKSSFRSYIWDLDNHKTDLRQSISELTPGGISTSQWLQS